MKKLLIAILVFISSQSFGQLKTVKIVGGAISSAVTAPQTLTDASTVTWNISLGSNATLTIGGNRTLSITNASAGTYGTLKITQDGTGSRTLALPASSKVVSSGAGVISLSTAAGSVDIITFFFDGTSYYWNYGKNYN